MSGGAVVCLTGLPRSGKSTLARAAHARLAARAVAAVTLDGDEVRAALSPTPGYDPEARDCFYATLARLAVLIARQGHVVLVAATAHRRRYRDLARELSPAFVEVHVATPLSACRERDPAGLCRAPTRDALPGVGVSYETPPAPEVTACGGEDDAAVDRIVALVG